MGWKAKFPYGRSVEHAGTFITNGCLLKA
jgi:hypothetical protein